MITKGNRYKQGWPKAAFIILYSLFISVALISCRRAEVPASFTESKIEANIYPDYRDVTVPVNIAPLHFELMAKADEVVTRFSGGGEEIVCDGQKARPTIDDWRQLTTKSQGKAVTVEVFARQDGQWTRFKPFNIYVSPDSIDPWMSYRLISPSYVSFEGLTINQRCLENYDEQIIYNNMLCTTEADGQCINCHNYQRGNPERMQFHARLNHGGTLINYDGKLRKVNLKNDSTISAGVYPAWHPTLPIIAYSTNSTMQMFHTRDLNKIEVLDSRSDLILYDLERNEVSNIENSPVEFETFPCWSPDGQWLYYSSAHFENNDSISDEGAVIRNYKELKYNIYRKPFDAKTLTFGPAELVFDAAALGLSATLPRVSPDGRWLLLSVGEWGCFHIWHRDADLWLIKAPSNLPQLGEASTADNAQQGGNSSVQPTSSSRGKQEGASGAFPLSEVNSPDVEAYHTWSQNGRWIVFSSRRYDGNYTRPFFAHVDKDGHATKPFELPADDPDYHRQLMKSYNIPELMRGPVTTTPQQLADALKKEADKAGFAHK